MTDKKTAVAPQIQSTTEYSRFRFIPGNRQVYPGHVAKLTAYILENNRLASNPGEVYEDGGYLWIVDGQHRFTAAKNNNLEYYYIVIPKEKAQLRDIQRQNSSSKAWIGYDYLQSYVDRPSYKKIKEYVDMGMTLSNALAILSSVGGGKGGGWTAFKRGDFIVTNEEAADVLAQTYIAIKPFCYIRAWNDREFVVALKSVAKSVSAEELIARLNAYGEKIDAQTTTKEYQRRFEEIINYGKSKNFIRLF